MKSALSARTALLLSACALLQAACASESTEVPASIWSLELVTPAAPASLASATSATVRLRKDGKPQANQEIILRAGQGPVTLTSPTGKTGADGTVQVQAITGAWSVPHRLVAESQGEVLNIPLPLEQTDPRDTLPFGDVNGWMVAQKIDGSTEDLAPTPDGNHMIIGVPGKLLKVAPDGTVTDWPLVGTVQQPLGLSFAPDGGLWVADSKAKALLRVDSAGKVEAKLSEIAGQPLKQPNDVAVLANGDVILSDPCLGQLIRYVPSSGQASVLVQFDLKTQGGPNGVAVDAAGTTLWFTTENTSLLCGDGLAALGDRLGSLWSLPLDGLPVAKLHVAGHGIFGDGLALDLDGVVYATFDDFNVDTLTLTASDVLAFDPASQQSSVVLRATDRLYANVAFGRGPFGDSKLYIALLSVPPFTDEALRGLQVFAGPVVPGLALSGSQQ
jgi:sugar lactone lactonase YvrE